MAKIDPRVIDWQPEEPTEIPKFTQEEVEFNGIITEYQPKFCQQVIEFCRNGGSVESFSGRFGIDPDAMIDWCNKSETSEFMRSCKIAMSAEYDYWEQMRKYCLDNIQICKDMLPTINRKLSEIGGYLLNNGLRKSLYKGYNPEEFAKNKLPEALSGFINE